MASKTEKTKKPTGLSITRSGNKFTLSWKIGDTDYGDGQYFQKIINDTGKDHWTPKKNTDIGKKQTSKSITIDKKDFYPYTTTKGGYKPYLYDIGMRVKGNRKSYTTGSGSKKKTHKPGSSDWASKKFDVKPPRKPSLSVALDSELTNVCKFTWDTAYYDDDQLIFTDVEWQTILVKNSKETDGSKLSWKNATKGSAAASSSKEITEDTAILYKNGNSYTRWFRVRARGPAGASAWVYKKHVYALSHQASSVKTSAKETATGGFQCIVNWSVGQSGGQNPIDKTAVQYTIVTPDEGLACPSGASWTDANISRDTGDGDSAVFSIDDQLSKDQCLFIRVNTQHDSNITYGKPQLSKVGFLKDPTGLSVQTDNTTHRATITANNTSDVEDSVLVVRYIPATGDPIDVGVIPHGSTSVTAQCPNWDGQASIAFAVYAMVGSYTKQSRSDNVDAYTIVARMRSENTISQGGAVPVAPENVTVNRVENKPDTIQVTWDWPWSAAGSAEISWSDHDDAWESTDEPESYTISNLHASKWNISGLETGKTWYVRVRLIAGDANNQETVTYGPWSDIEKGIIDLSSAPNKPVLMLSNAIIPEDGNTTASWVYTTTDNTPQEYAEIAVVENGVYLTPPIAHTLTAQHITINAISAGFTTGAVYNLACRVRSASGRISEWSDPVAVTIAEPLECEITNTSLVQEHIENNPREFDPADIVSFETDAEEDVTKLKVDIVPKQSGSGTPSPSNIRPISGWSSVNVMVSPTEDEADGTTTTTSLGRTVYGGTLDVVTGVLTETKSIIDLGTLSWSRSATGTSGKYRFVTYIPSPNGAKQSDKTSGVTSLCNKMDTLASGKTFDANTDGYTISANGDIYVYLDAYNTASAADFKTAMSGYQLVYTRATPQTYQLTPTEISTLLGDNNVWADAGQVEIRIAESSRDIWALKEMPLSVTATGAGVGGITAAVIERAESYHLERPDENDFNGHDREAIALKSQVGESEISFDVDDLIGSLDDGAKYRLVVTVQDGLGQTATVPREFEVHWRHQALIPSATVVMDEEELIAIITPIAPTGVEEGDVADIYRLSIDKPELVVQGGVFGQTYVDPYPALGEMGGYRIVLRTKNGDYITEDNEFAMVDSPELGVNPIENEEQLNIIDFEGRQIRFYWDTDYSNTWAKDFQETQYMGGATQGDWNKAVSRSGTLSSQAITVLDQEMLQAVRRLAEHPGITHVRTADGSSYAADVQVSEDRVHDDQEMVVNYSLSITRVDSQGLDGMTLEQYTAENSEEE